MAHATTLPPPPEDPFTIFVSTLVDGAIHENAAHVAAALPALLGAGVHPHSMGPEATQALREGGTADGLDAMPVFSATTAAWSAILRGTSEDFSACGNGMLDEWAADLLARLLGAPSRVPALRRQLRARGVAAFGVGLRRLMARATSRGYSCSSERKRGAMFRTAPLLLIEPSNRFADARPSSFGRTKSGIISDS